MHANPLVPSAPACETGTDTCHGGFTEKGNKTDSAVKTGRCGRPGGLTTPWHRVPGQFSPSHTGSPVARQSPHLLAKHSSTAPRWRLGIGAAARDISSRKASWISQTLTLVLSLFLRAFPEVSGLCHLLSLSSRPQGKSESLPQ